jgi:MarR family transcriptional regulator, organic hydroperoxide resistance regulator
MSISKPGRKRASGHRAATRAVEIKAARPNLPVTVSRPALLEGRSDRRFRRLVYDLLTIASRMTEVREHLAGGMGITAPQFSLLLAIGQFQAERGVGVTAVARVLHVSSAFVATETGKLAQSGLLTKRANPKDRRAVLLSLTRAGRALIERNSDEIRSVNDAFFGALTRNKFAALSTAMADLVHSSARATAQLGRTEPGSWREAAE